MEWEILDKNNVENPQLPLRINVWGKSKIHHKIELTFGQKWSKSVFWWVFFFHKEPKHNTTVWLLLCVTRYIFLNFQFKNNNIDAILFVFTLMEPLIYITDLKKKKNVCKKTDCFLTVCKIHVDPLSDCWKKTAKLTKRPRINNGDGDGCWGPGDSRVTNDCRWSTGNGRDKTEKRECRWSNTSLACTWKQLIGYI